MAEGNDDYGLLRKAGAALAGILAARIALYALATLWRLATREDPPQADSATPVAKKAAWLALAGAAAGATRQAARDYVKPPQAGVV